MMYSSHHMRRCCRGDGVDRLDLCVPEFRKFTSAEGSPEPCGLVRGTQSVADAHFVDGRSAGHLGAADGLKTCSIQCASVHTLECNLPHSLGQTPTHPLGQNPLPPTGPD